MDTDLQYYTRLMISERSAAARAATPDACRAHERRAQAFALQLQRLAAEPATSAPECRLRPLPLAA